MRLFELVKVGAPPLFNRPKPVQFLLAREDLTPRTQLP